MDRRLVAALVVAGMTATACGSSPTKQTEQSSSTTASQPAERHTRQFIPELGIYISMPTDWVAFADGVHDNMGMVTFQVRPKWESTELGQYVRIRKLAPTPQEPQIQTWLNASNADAVNDFVKERKSKVTQDKRDSWDGPGLPGASANLELEQRPAAAGQPAPTTAPKIYVAFVGQGDQRWQIATTNANTPGGSPADEFLGPQADAIARSAQRITS